MDGNYAAKAGLYRLGQNDERPPVLPDSGLAALSPVGKDATPALQQDMRSPIHPTADAMKAGKTRAGYLVGTCYRPFGL